MNKCIFTLQVNSKNLKAYEIKSYLLHEAVLHHGHDLLLGDVAVLVQVVDIEAELGPLLFIS